MNSSDEAPEPESGTLERQARAALAAGEVDAAVALAERVIAAGRETPLLLNLNAHGREVEGRYPEAMALLNRALRLAPDDPFILNSLGACHAKSGRPHQALDAFDAALAARPDFAPAHHGRGLCLSALGDRAGARAAQETAMALDPRFPEPPGALAALAAEDGDFAAARSHATRALALDPRQPAAMLCLATLEMRQGDHGRVVERTGALLAQGNPTLLHQASAQRLRADALDALGRAKDAMAAYAAANAALRQVYMAGVEEAGVELGVEHCGRLLAHFTAASPRWSRPPAVDAGAGGEARAHAFIVGFLRSGTTLLEQVLASHPDVVTLEEKPTLDPMLGEVFADAAALERLGALDGDEAARRRRDYWGRVAGFGVDATGKVFIDKAPLMSLYLPLVAKLFPRARIILAVRDPRDVVLSCFRRRFRPNSLVIEYTDLERTALFHDGAMRLAQLYRRRLPLQFHIHRHEHLVEHFDAETRGLCAFLGIAWRESLRDFAQTARRREILTPSADQVRRGLYREGMGQWRRYRDELDAVLPILEPWVREFGYPPTETPILANGTADTNLAPQFSCGRRRS